MARETYSKLSEIPARMRFLDGVGLTLAQVNSINAAAEAVSANIEDADAYAVQQFKDAHRVNKGRWEELGGERTETPLKFEIGIPMFPDDDSSDSLPPSGGKGANGCTWERHEPTADFAYPTYTIKGVHILQVGTWITSSGSEFKCRPETIAAMIKNSRTDGLPLNFGHETPDARMPAIGWMENLRAGDDGNALYADFTRLDPWVFGDIASGAYRKRSIEFVGGNGEKSEIIGCALVGRWQSAVVLKDCFSSDQKQESVHLESFVSESLVGNDENDTDKTTSKEGENLMSKELEAKIELLTSEIGAGKEKFEALSAENEAVKSELTAAKTENETLQKQVSELQSKVAEQDCEIFFAANAKKVTPAEIESLKSTYMSLSGDADALATFKKGIEVRADHPALDESGKDTGHDSGDPADYETKLRKYAEENRLDLSKSADYKIAACAVLTAPITKELEEGEN